MNSIDAGATRINLTIDKDRFSLDDDGHGFTSLDQLENFFEVFGTPHEKGDAYYGRFRIGRGQIMSYARTVWRSGPFEMRVDIEANEEDLGYDLVVHNNNAVGCRIEGEFYETNWLHMPSCHSDKFSVDGIGYDFLRLICYVPVPVFVNGKQVNEIPEDQEWDFEDDHAWYRVCRDDSNMSVFNRGVFVQSVRGAYFGMGGVVVTKQPLLVNMARNTLIERNCPVWEHVRKVLFDHLNSRLIKARKLDINERAKLLDDLLFGERVISMIEAQQIRKIRFIPDIFGQLQTPDKFLEGRAYTLFDKKHFMIAERVQKQGRAAVLMREMFHRTRLNVKEEFNYIWAINRLRYQLGISRCSDDKVLWQDFEELVQEMADTTVILEDKDLKKEEMIVLHTLRYLNNNFFGLWLAGGYRNRRTVLAGESDTMTAWTDGKTYIAVDRKMLRSIRQSGATKLVLLMIHEYCHNETSTGNHAHDFDFYNQFHHFSLSDKVGYCADLLFRRYVEGIRKESIVPSSATRHHVNYLAERSPYLRSKFKNGYQGSC